MLINSIYLSCAFFQVDQKMTQNLGIRVITPETSIWTCKVQIVDICGPGKSKEERIKCLNMIVQDEHVLLHFLQINNNIINVFLII